jgi:hypothetical protein
MMHATPTPPTMKDAIAYMEAHGTDNQKQDIRKASKAFALNGYEAADFDIFPADLAIFDQRITKLSGTMPGLQRLIHATGISDNTYKQSWRAGRRLIAEFIGASTEKKTLRARKDDWSELLNRVDILARAGLLRPQTRYALPALAEACRPLHIGPSDLTAELVTALLVTDGSHQRKTLRKALKALDTLHGTHRLANLLPAGPVTPPPKKSGRLVTLPPHMQAAIKRWVNHAAREQVEDARYDHLAEPLSASARNRYSAALSLWIQTLFKDGADLPEGTGLAELFETGRVDSVLGRWSSEKTHAPRTNYNYTIDLAAILSRHGFSDEASYVVGLTKIVTGLKEGRAAEKSMSRSVKKWCESLHRSPQKTALFDTQHLEYYRLAMSALETAKAEGINLCALSDPARMAALPQVDRSRAKVLQRRARMFGLLAAYAAIALEGAPYRRQNILSIRHTGPKKTIFLHLSGPSPHAIVKFPNEELKNGKWLTERGEELEAITIQKRGDGDFGAPILKFYLREIRPLFAEGEKTHCLFPPIEEARTTETGFIPGTFSVWMAEGSAEIGLPLSSHNFRHGYCSIAINEGRMSMEDLAKIMGDTVATLRRYYAWINGKLSVVAVQKDIARRRAELMKSRNGGAR